MTALTPTQQTYNALDEAYAFFNARLFGGILPPCLITIQRRKGSYGYFSANRFSRASGEEVTDEIAINPTHFKDRTVEDICSTLVRGMVYLWQHHHGTPSQAGYHNTEWAAKMEAVGLIPTTTGKLGGKKTGQKMSHVIAQQGVFQEACRDLVAGGFTIAYVDVRTDEQIARKKAVSKTKYTCPDCKLNAWAKPEAHLQCGACSTRMEPAEAA